MRRLTFFVACALCAWLPTLAQAAPSDVVRQTQFGKVLGVDDSAASATYVWKGVPYAKPPVGKLRWRAPVDPDGWKTTLSAQQFANACVQYGRIYGPGANNTFDMTIATTLNQAVGSEDCLYLNIWRPAASYVICLGTTKRCLASDCIAAARKCPRITRVRERSVNSNSGRT